MTSYPAATDTALEASIQRHLSRCDGGRARCQDCAAMLDAGVVGALGVARAEVAAVDGWLRSHRWTCAYCSQPADARDHLVPLPWSGRALRPLVPTVPACQDCNVRISDSPVFTVAGRCEVAARSLRRRHARDLRIPDRDDAWFAGLSGRMRANMLAAQFRRQTLRRRLIILDGGGSPVFPDHLLIAP